MAALLAAAILGADATVDEKANDIDPNACPEEAPQPTARARVRRSISTLTDDEWDRVTDAMWVMRTTDTPTGQARYGSQYYDWEYFVLRHVVSSVCINEDDAWRDPDLDTTGHDLFAIWHGVQLVEFENALVSVDPQIDGLPYLDYKEIADVRIAASRPRTCPWQHQRIDSRIHLCAASACSPPRSHTPPHAPHTPHTPSPCRNRIWSTTTTSRRPSRGDSDRRSRNRPSRATSACRPTGRLRGGPSSTTRRSPTPSRRSRAWRRPTAATAPRSRRRSRRASSTAHSGSCARARMTARGQSGRVLAAA
tara:strand:- start:2498 stop:3421 length:924 start_codon:yes stop_codon:yes gene_type:complete